MPATNCDKYRVGLPWRPIQNHFVQTHRTGR